MKNKECYYVVRGIPFDEQYLIYRIFNGESQMNSPKNNSLLGIEKVLRKGWTPVPLPYNVTRIPTWQAKAMWTNICK